MRGRDPLRKRVTKNKKPVSIPACRSIVTVRTGTAEEMCPLLAKPMFLYRVIGNNYQMEE
jgi:hypothetical protein